jgi:hypothetical protein
VLAAAASLMTLTSNLLAESSRVPTPLANRNLVVPKATLLLDGGPRWILPEGQFVYEHNPGGDPAWINAGATFGITQDFQLGFVIPMQVLPDGFDLHDPRVHLLYQFVEGTADVGLFVQGSLPFEGDFHTRIGLPIQIHLGSVARLDTGPFLRAGFTGNDDDETYADFSIPFVVPINITRQFFFGPETALWTENEFDYVSIPFGLFFGYTMTSGGSTVGDLSVRWRDLNVRDAGDAGNVWRLIFAADLFFDL